MTPLQRERAGQQKKRVALIVIGVVLILCFVAYRVSIFGQAPGMLQDELKAAAQDGLPLTADDLRKQIAVPGAENGASALKAAFAKYRDWAKTDGAWLTKISRNIEPMTDAEIIGNETNLESAKPVLDQLQYAVTFPKLAFDREWEKGYDVTYPEFADAIYCRQLLYLRYRIQAAKGDTNRSLDTLETLAKLSALMSQDPTVIGLLAGSATQGVACDGVARVLRAHGSDKTILERCRSIVATLNPKTDLRRVLSTEFYTGLTSSRLLGSPAGDKLFNNSDGVDKIGRIGPAKDIFVLRYVQTMRSIYNVVNVNGGDLRKMRMALEDLDSEPRDWTYGLVNVIGGAYSGFVSALATDRGRVNVLTAGIDLLESKAKSGSFPASILGTTGEWLDPFTDRPLTYKRSAKGFLIYSFGPDGKDDGGKPRSRNAMNDKFDLPFSYPE